MSLRQWDFSISRIYENIGDPSRISDIFYVDMLFEQQLGHFDEVVPAVHPGMSAARIHCLVLDASFVELLLEGERRLVEEV